MSGEVRDIPGYPGYRAGDDGSVYSRWKGSKNLSVKSPWRKLRQWVHPDGYMGVGAKREGGSHSTHKVHHLILFAFVGPRPDGHDGCHADGNRKNNCPSNLRWATRKENEADKIVHGTKLLGEKLHWASLTTDDVVVIKRHLKRGYRQADLARQFGVCQPTISLINTGKTWSHVE